MICVKWNARGKMQISSEISPGPSVYMTPIQLEFTSKQKGNP